MARMRRLGRALAVAWLPCLPAVAAERALDKEVIVAATLDRAWGNVLGNLKTRFETGPIDWSEWLKQLEQWRAAEAAKKAEKAASTPQ